mmetsp:Transcript_35191/g.64261  ORF Transcript_35191/g.64261 Transcript_35191/m.64261 type:complete len:277 (+) Transcript_35191:66-896(+)
MVAIWGATRSNDGCAAVEHELEQMLAIAADEPAFITLAHGGRVLVSTWGSSGGPAHTRFVPGSCEALVNSASSKVVHSPPPGLTCELGGDLFSIVEMLAHPETEMKKQQQQLACTTDVKQARDSNSRDSSPASEAQESNSWEAVGFKVSVPSMVRAAERGDVAAVANRLAAGDDANCQDDFGVTALHSAARKGHLGVVLLLLNHGADVHMAQSRGETALHYACKYGHEGVVAALLHCGADTEATCLKGCTPRQYAEDKSQSRVLRVLDAFASPPHC